VADVLRRTLGVVVTWSNIESHMEYIIDLLELLFYLF